MDDINKVKKKISEIKEAVSKERNSSKLFPIDNDQYESFVEIAKLCNKILESKEYKYDKAHASYAEVYIKNFKVLLIERLKKITRSVIEGEDPDALNLTKLERELYEKLSDVISWFNTQVLKGEEEELVIIHITSGTNEPILDLEGRFLSLSSGDILRTKRSIAKHLVDVGIAAYVDYK
ncbi:MAG: hypothetical protein DRN26_03670 [Thermoplasmata archaeon]|nr:MAG: hypothetical protein DRN26_03670 [Thermoplasmata archaeon]